MPLSPELEQCLAAVTEVYELTEMLSGITKRLAAVVESLTRHPDSFYFDNISTQTTSGISRAAEVGHDGSNWPSPDQIQRLVIAIYQAKHRAAEAYSRLNPAEQRAINLPAGLRR